MAIETIPQIIASNSSGGIVYSIEFQRGFSIEASKLTYKIVNNSGSYSLPALDSSASISFGSFNFDGYVYSYELDESNSGNILSITLVDKSVILDKLYVCVFRRGLFNFKGTSTKKNIPVEFTNEDIYYSLDISSSGVKVLKKNYTNGSVQRTVYGGTKKEGNIIIVGTEEDPDTNCEIPSSSYSFNELKSAVGNSVFGFSNCPINDSEIKKTYEGSLRSVLNSWCQDFGYYYYWDYSSNSLKFLDLRNGVFNIPKSISDKKIVSKKQTASVEGKFNQISVDYFAKPYTPKSTQLTNGNTFYYRSSQNPYPVSYFASKQGSGLSNDSVQTGGNFFGQDNLLDQTSASVYGGTRTGVEFVTSALLGYISPTLRKIYNYSWIANWGGNVGIGGSGIQGVEMAKIIRALANGGQIDLVEHMKSFSGKAEGDLDSSFSAILVKYDQGTEDAWFNLEQDILTTKIGNFYPMSFSSSSSKYCSSSEIVSFSVQVEPEGTLMSENDGSVLSGRRVFSRGAPGPDKSPQQALEELGLSAETEDNNIAQLIPKQINLLEKSELFNSLTNEGIATEGYDTLLIVPTAALVFKKIKFSIYPGTAFNKKETAVGDLQGNSGDSCGINDLSADKCLSKKEELKKKQREKQDSNNSGSSVPFKSGLLYKNAHSATVGIGDKNVTISSSSTSPYQIVTTVNYSVELLYDITEAEQLISNVSGDTSSSENIIETRLIVENRTTAEKLNSTKNLSPKDLSSRVGYKQSKNIEKVVYSCAGFVSSLPTSPESGLESIDMSISDNGFSATYSYSNRPASLPSQDLLRTVIGSNSSQPAIQIR